MKQRELLRLIVCGSVDDGKSSLIGRLLYDSKSLFDDQIAGLKTMQDAAGNSRINLATITDGLKSEREQGITIDVAYRFFATKKRKFIIADTPGHLQYTRNMVTGASTAQLAIIMIDSRKGILEQTRRHSFIADLLGIKNVIFCINKMDQVSYDQNVYDQIVVDLKRFTKNLKFKKKIFLPISALLGDNIVKSSENMPWYTGKSLLKTLETIELGIENQIRTRFPVQNVIRVHDPEFRGYAGKISSGTLEVNDEILILPSAQKTRIKSIWIGEEKLKIAYANQSIVIETQDEVDIGRGNLIIKTETLPYLEREADAEVCWMSETSLTLNKKYLIKTSVQSMPVLISKVVHKLDIASQAKEIGAEIGMNEIGRVKIRGNSQIIYDDYYENPGLGSFILIDEATNQTVACGMLRKNTSIIDFFI